MLTLLPLESLGPRICVCGPSNAGKSTLAAALARRMGIDPTYLDLLHHQPHTNWVARPREEFDAAHSAAIARDRWVIEGNYMRLLPERMHRATGILLLGTDRWSAFGRYLRRTLFEHQRHGMLDGAQDSLKWVMIRYILIDQPRKRERDINLLRATGLPMVQLSSMRELQAAYAVWGLERPPVTSPPA